MRHSARRARARRLGDQAGQALNDLATGAGASANPATRRNLERSARDLIAGLGASGVLGAEEAAALETRVRESVTRTAARRQVQRDPAGMAGVLETAVLDLPADEKAALQAELAPRQAAARRERVRAEHAATKGAARALDQERSAATTGLLTRFASGALSHTDLADARLARNAPPAATARAFEAALARPAPGEGGTAEDDTVDDPAAVHAITAGLTAGHDQSHAIIAGLGAGNVTLATAQRLLARNAARATPAASTPRAAAHAGLRARITASVSRSLGRPGGTTLGVLEHRLLAAQAALDAALDAGTPIHEAIASVADAHTIRPDPAALPKPRFLRAAVFTAAALEDARIGATLAAARGEIAPAVYRDELRRIEAVEIAQRAGDHEETRQTEMHSEAGRASFRAAIAADEVSDVDDTDTARSGEAAEDDLAVIQVAQHDEDADAAREEEAAFTTADRVVQFFGGTNRSLAGIAGAPVDAVNDVLRWLGLPVSDTPIGGSRSIEQAMASAGMIGPEPTDELGRLLETGGGVFGGILVPLSILRAIRTAQNRARGAAGAAAGSRLPALGPPKESGTNLPGSPSGVETSDENPSLQSPGSTASRQPSPRVTAPGATNNPLPKLDDRTLVDRAEREFDTEFRRLPQGRLKVQLDFRRLAPTTKEAIRGFVGALLSKRLPTDGRHVAELVLGTIEPDTARKISDKLGGDFTDFVYTIESHRLDHNVSQHFGENEKNSENIPLTIIDISQILDVINDPSTKVVANPRPQGQRITFRLERPNGTVFVIESVGGARPNQLVNTGQGRQRALRFVNMFIKRANTP